MSVANIKKEKPLKHQRRLGLQLSQKDIAHLSEIYVVIRSRFSEISQTCLLSLHARPLSLDGGQSYYPTTPKDTPRRPTIPKRHIKIP